jgi:hypothetical protein
MRTLCVALAMCIASSSVWAKTDVEKFIAEQPAVLQAELLDYYICSASAAGKAWRRGISFGDLETAIANECKRHLPFRPAQAKRAEVIAEFARLAIEERRLRYLGRPIPGYEPGPLAAEFLRCSKSNREAQAAVEACFADRAGPFIRGSNEPAETIALAVEGACQEPLAKYRSSLAGCGIPPADISSISGGLLNRLRTVVISAVLQARVQP